MQLFPDAKLGFGPPTDDGFYYDIDVSRPFTPDDLDKITAIMKAAIDKNWPFVYKEHPRDEIKALHRGQPYKLELIDEIPEDEALSTYTHDGFTDLCKGPHVDSTAQIPAFKLLNVAGAYWRGSETRPMLQRIYGTAFESKEALDEHLHRLEEAEKRDHRKLGVELGLFLFNPIAPASPFFLPKGAKLYNTLVDYVRGLYKEYGYNEVITPQIFDTDLWKRSGHYEHYIENMYVVKTEEREYGVKPMNCPAHALIFGAGLHSYRDLPIRLADFGRLHRYERSGVTHGLTRVRTFAQDDAHIFCTPDQAEAEVHSFIKMLDETYKLLGFNDVRIALSLRPEKRVGSDDLWDQAERILAEALEHRNLAFDVMPGEGAFYGPKIDFFVADAIGREWQLGTIQLDYNLPVRFGLEFIAQDGTRQRPVVLHRAMLGSLERFLGVLIEHYGGAFPLWLAPVQAVVIPIADRHLEYAHTVQSQLAGHGFRVDVDSRNERMNLKIREAQLQKVPYMLVVGDREAQQGAAAVRTRDGQDLKALPISQILQRLQEESSARK
ncbi:MAG: threonine--tRNA ligase [SAR202 cluster bacterium]|nr:threonine--tRNA ligase [SAR202 cluster bacterium]